MLAAQPGAERVEDVVAIIIASDHVDQAAHARSDVAPPAKLANWPQRRPVGDQRQWRDPYEVGAISPGQEM